MTGFLRRLTGHPLGAICLGYLMLLTAIAIAAPILLPDVAGETAGELLEVREGPSASHPLGTDTLGRDVLQRLLVGTRVTLLGVLEAVVVAVAIGVPLGLVAGYMRGRVDRVIGFFVDLALSIPAIIIIVVVLAVYPDSMAAAMVAFGVLASANLLRVVRAATLTVREELYIAAARVSGLKQGYIMLHHVLPRISGPVIVQTSLLAALALIVQTGLSFLGLIVPAPAPSWGGMIADGLAAIDLQPWLLWPPGIAIALTILAIALLGDAVRDAQAERWRPAQRPRKRTRPRPARRAQPAVSAPPPADTSALLSVDQLNVSISASDGVVPVISDATFAVKAGESVGLVGESGCGKTMTALAVLGLLPDVARVESGAIRLDGQDLTASSDRELRRVRGKQVAFVAQEPMVSLTPAFRIGWQLNEVVRLHTGLSRKAAQKRVIDLLGRVHLPDPAGVAQKYPHELSGGMAQRVSIARALAGEPRLLIADEPTTALDVTVQAEILALLRELQEQDGMALLLVTHDWGVVADICDRVVVMYAGEVVERADLLPLIEEPLHPYTEALLSSNPHGAVRGQLLPTITGSVPGLGSWPTGCRFQPRCRYATSACGVQPIGLAKPEESRETRCIHYTRLREDNE